MTGRQTGDEEALAAGLRYGAVDDLTLTRRRCGRGFTYLDSSGKPVRDRKTLRRVRSLAIPPAYTEVRIAARADQHLQAVGRDEAGRLQYLYHPSWEEVREARKQDRLAALCAALPRLRRHLARALRKPGLGRRKALAAAVTLIDRTHIRVGSGDYVHSGRSRGAATLLKQNVRCDGDYVRLSFRGKRQQPVQCSIYAPALARALTELREIPGRRIFQYLDADGRRHRISAGDINAYLQEISGCDISAKDFRTLAATAAAGQRLCIADPAARARQRKRQVAEVMREVSELLGNTPTVARKSYVHRVLIEAFESGRLSVLGRAKRQCRNLSPGEALVAALFPRDETAGTVEC